MENRKTRVAITQGDSNGIGFELIFRTFAEPDMLEICTPIIYGSPKVASYHCKALDLHGQFSIINSMDEVREGRVNLLVCLDDEIKIELGKRTPESAVPALKALSMAVSDSKKGLVDVLVCGPIDDRTIQLSETEQINLGRYINRLIDKEGQSLKVYQNALVRMIVAHDGAIKTVMDDISTEKIIAKVKALHAALKRDFLINNPRIAVLSLNAADGDEEIDILQPAIKALVDENMHVFGPYKSHTFFTNRHYAAFDACLAMYPEQALLPMSMLTEAETVAIQIGLPFVCTMPTCDAQMEIAGQGKADVTLMRNAIYTGVDIFKARNDYDEAGANPLPKLYKEHSDSGERPYFAPIKKKEETTNGQL